MQKSAKIAWRDRIVGSFDKAGALFLAHYQGMTVEELTALRRELKAVNAEFKVVKNSIARKAVEGRGESVISANFKGQTGIVYAYGDIAAAAKAFSDSVKKNDKLKIVGGYMETASLSAQQIAMLASLPSREVLLSKIIGSLVSPHRGILGVMQGVPRAMVSVLNQIKEQKTA